MKLEAATLEGARLTYFDSQSARGQDCRNALSYAGIDFEDDRVPFADWPKKKSSTLFGSLPMLTLKGGYRLGQSNVILSFIGQCTGLLPEDPLESARLVSLMHYVEDVRSRFLSTLLSKDPGYVATTRKQLAAEYMPAWCEHMEAQIRGPWISGREISVSDFKLCGLIGWIKSGGLDHVNPALFDDYEGIMRVYQSLPSLLSNNDS